MEQQEHASAMPAHTKGPWSIYWSAVRGPAIVSASGGTVVALMSRALDTPAAQKKADAERIVRCSNSHDELVAALRETAAVCEQILVNRALVQISGPLAQARAALAKAGAA